MLLAGRRELGPADRQSAAEANARHLHGIVAGTVTVCAYLPLASEPLAPTLLDELTDAGVRVLVPVVTGAAPLDWTDYSAARRSADGGPLPRRPGPVGIDQLDVPLLGPAAVAMADLVLVPALAVDPAGFRLGRGGGHYDRTLALHATLTDRRPPLIAVLHDVEVLPAVPHDELDVPMTLLVTPTGGVRPPV